MAANKRYQSTGNVTTAPGAEVKAPTSTGFGDSRVFAEPQEPQRDWSRLTVNGKPIPEHLWNGVMPYSLTDQAIEEREQEREFEPSGIELGKTPELKHIEAFGDGIKAGMQPWETPDPMRELVDKYGSKGDRHRFLSPAKVEREGLRGWEPVMVTENGVKTQVKLGNMFLGRMPKERAAARDRHMRDRAHNQMVQANDVVKEQQEQIMSKARIDRMNRRRGVDDRDEGLVTHRGDALEMEDRDFATS